MKIFIDTANIDEIKRAVAWGVVDGVTTNPTLVAREKRNFKELVEHIIRIVNGPISVEVISTETDGMVKEAIEMSRWSPNIVIKIPMTPDGLSAVKILNGQGIKTNVTLVFSVNQALLAAKAGATYVSPFIGRLDDIGYDGMQAGPGHDPCFQGISFQNRDHCCKRKASFACCRSCKIRRRCGDITVCCDREDVQTSPD